METTALAPAAPHRENHAITRPADEGELGLITGESGRMTLKRLELAYGVGGLSALGYNPGDMVIDKKCRVLSRSMPPKYNKVEVVVISAQRFIKEWLSPDMAAAKVQPRRWQTIEAALADGMEPEWTDGATGRVPPNVSGAVDLKLLIKTPEWAVVNQAGEPDGEERFIFDLGADGLWCPTQFCADKMNFERFDQMLTNTQLVQARKQGVKPAQAKLFHCIFTLHTEVVHKGKRDMIMPTFQRKMLPGADGKPMPAELSAEAQQILVDMLPGLVTARVDDEEFVPPKDDVPA